MSADIYWPANKIFLLPSLELTMRVGHPWCLSVDINDYCGVAENNPYPSVARWWFPRETSRGCNRSGTCPAGCPAPAWPSAAHPPSWSWSSRPTCGPGSPAERWGGDKTRVLYIKIFLFMSLCKVLDDHVLKHLTFILIFQYVDYIVSCKTSHLTLPSLL